MGPPLGVVALGTLRGAIRDRRRVRFRYRVRNGKESSREVRPLALAFWGRIWSMGGWCELQQDFRNFRVDRVSDVTVTSTFADEPAKTLDDFIRAAVASAAHGEAKTT